MTPADIKVEWPTPDEIARAVFAAAMLEGHDPIDVLQGAGSARVRAYAALALAHQFPTAPRGALGRKCGSETCLQNFRKSLLSGKVSWLDLSRLNAVRAALGWSDMTMDEVRVAPMIYNGRPWQDFVDRGAQQREAPTSSAVEPAAGSGGDETPASDLLDRKLDEQSAHPLSSDGRNPVAESGGDEDSAPASLDRPPVEEAAPLALTDVANPGAGAESDAPPATISKAARVAAVERRKAFLRGDAPVAREIADARRLRDELTERLLSESHRGVTSFRPDPPAEKRGAVNVTHDLMGDPSPGRSALAQRGLSS